MVLSPLKHLWPVDRSRYPHTEVDNDRHLVNLDYIFNSGIADLV
jgi:hypothetical protein